MRYSLWSLCLLIQNQIRDSQPQCAFTDTLTFHSVFTVPTYNLFFRLFFVGDGAGKGSECTRTLTHARTWTHLSKHTLLSRRSPAVLPVYAGWSFPRNLMLVCSSPVGESYVCVFPGNCPLVSWFLGTTETCHLFIWTENFWNLQKPFFMLTHFQLKSIIELNVVGHQAWLHKCFACKIRSSVQAKVC